MPKLSITNQLTKPFRQDDYEWRAQSENYDGTQITVLCYVTARAIQTRLDEVFGPFGWSTTYRAGPDGGVVCELSCFDKENKIWVKKEDAAPNTDIESVKGGISNAFKRAAAAGWGIGRLLYKLEATKVPLKENGKHYHKVKKEGPNKGKWKYWDEPKLPAWAMAGKAEKKPDVEETTEKDPPSEPPKDESTENELDQAMGDAIDHKAAFAATFDALCKKQNIDNSKWSVPVRIAVFNELLNSIEVSEAMRNPVLKGYAAPLGAEKMHKAHTGWLVLNHAVKTFDIQTAMLQAVHAEANKQWEARYRNSSAR